MATKRSGAIQKMLAGLGREKPTKPTLPVREGEYWRHRYDRLYRCAMPDWMVELDCWVTRTALDPYLHLRRAAEALCPQSLWHPWREWRFRALCDMDNCYQFHGVRIWNMSWVGAGASGKTNDAALFAFLYWLADPAVSYVIFTSTSKTKIKQRTWAIVQECYASARALMDETNVIGPHMLNSTMELQCVKGDSKHAIFAQAIESGETAKAVNNLLGVHAERIVLVIDEAPGTPEAIYRTIPNMLKGCQEFVLINIGNGPQTHLDCFSKVCTPEKGWTSISVESEQWRTKPVPEFQLPWGTCLHFDGKKSPNVMAGKTLYPFLYTWENWKRVEGNPDAQRCVEFYIQDRGFWPPEGTNNTVLSEELIEQGNARGELAFDGRTTPCGSVDPAFGGDACTLRFGKCGRLKGTDKLGLQLAERIIIPILVDEVDDQGRKLPAEYQIVRRVRAECDKRGVVPQWFGVESTGTGRGVAAILLQEWGEVAAVESGGKASDRPASEEDPRPSHEVYDRRITELWFSVRAFVTSRQLGGLCDDDVIQFCARTYAFEGRKYKLEKKDELKLRLGRSPDDADSAAVLVEVCRRHGMGTQGPRAERMWETWRGVRNAQEELLDEDALYAPEEPDADNEAASDDQLTYDPA